MTAAVLLAACGVDEVPVPISQEYERDFIKTFGLVDENQTWRMVEQATVTVEAEEPSNVKAYVNVNGTYHIVADYKDVQGTQTLTFDVPANVQDIKVYVNGIPYGTVSLAFIAPRVTVSSLVPTSTSITLLVRLKLISQTRKITRLSFPRAKIIVIKMA